MTTSQPRITLQQFSPSTPHYIIKWSILSLDHRDAWKRLGDVPKEEAMQQYIGLVSSVDPDWQTTKLDPSQLVRGSWSLASCPQALLLRKTLGMRLRGHSLAWTGNKSAAHQ